MRASAGRGDETACALAPEVGMPHVLAAWAHVLAMHADASAVDLVVEGTGGRTVALWSGERPEPAELPDGELRVAARLHRDTATWDCDVTLRIAPDDRVATIRVDPPGLPDGFLATLADHLEHTAAWFARGASAPPPLSPRDRRAYQELNRTRAPDAPRRRIDEAVAAAALRHPSRIAVVDGERRHTYRDLLDAAARTERRLLDQGCAVGDHVAVVLPRSFDAFAAYLAVLRLGAVYVPLDPRTPPGQLHGTLDRLTAPFVVSEHALGVEVRAPREGRRCAAMATETRRTAHDAACVMFTSGSTGTPKGVLLPHLALTRLLDDDRFRMFAADTVCLAASPVQWDCALFETWGTLIAGGTLILHQGPNPTPASLRDAARQGANTAWITASLLNVLIDEDVACFDGFSLIMSGGERLSPRHSARPPRRRPPTNWRSGHHRRRPASSSWPTRRTVPTSARWAASANWR
jgi:non-ribosomal peptide synthetase component F